MRVWIFTGGFQQVIDIRLEHHFSNRITVDVGWYDLWLHANDKEAIPANFEPLKVTPGLVSQAISFALSHTWDPGLKNSSTTLIYRNGTFEMKPFNPGARDDPNFGDSILPA